MKLFGKKQQEEAQVTTEVHKSIKEQIAPLVNTNKSIADRYDKLSAEESMTSEEILNVKNTFEVIMNEGEELADRMNRFQGTFQGIEQAAAGFGEVKQNILSSVDSAQEKVSELKKDSERVTESFTLMDQTFEDLKKAVDEIRECTGGINAIANQTNMLALNASIEAARAGEQGKGFAVVAEQVRSLAEEIKKLISLVNESIEHVDAGTKELSTTLETSQEALRVNDENVSQTHEIFEKVKEQTNQVEQVQQEISEQINNSVTDIDQLIDYTSSSRTHYETVLNCLDTIENSDSKKAALIDEIRGMLAQNESLTDSLTRNEI